jgi:Tfp pilus assembly protein PilF
VRRAALLVGALAVVVFANSLANRFAYDDARIILDNAELHSLETLPAAVFKPYWQASDGKLELGLWRPTTTLLLGLEYAVAGENPTLYHAVNVVAHGLVSLLVVLVLAHLVAMPIAFAAGLLFAVHPVHVEAVSNVVGGAEVVAAGFFLLALLLHMRGPASWSRALAVAALFALAFGAKEGAVTLPAVIFLVDAARRRLALADLLGYLREHWRVYASLAVVAALMLTARTQILGSVANPEVAVGARLLREIPRVWTLAEVWTHYIRLMVFPLDLASDYTPGVIPISTGFHALNTVGVLLVLLILTAALLSWRQPEMAARSTSARVFGFGVVWFTITVAPVALVFFVAGVMLGERTLYLPSVGAMVILAWLLVSLVRRRRGVGLAVLTLVVALMGWRSWTRTPTWLDDGTVFETLISDYPHSGRSQWLMGDIYMAQGRQSEALRAYREAIPNLGAHHGLTTQIGRKLLAAGNLRGAEGLLRQAWSEAPDFAAAPALLGVVYSQMGDAERTEQALVAALALQPDNGVSHHLMSSALSEQGRWAEAADARRRVIELGEDVWQQFVWLADLRSRAGDLDAARAALLSARERAGTDEEKAQIDSLAARLRMPTG